MASAPARRRWNRRHPKNSWCWRSSSGSPGSWKSSKFIGEKSRQASVSRLWWRNSHRASSSSSSSSLSSSAPPTSSFLSETFSRTECGLLGWSLLRTFEAGGCSCSSPPSSSESRRAEVIPCSSSSGHTGRIDRASLIPVEIFLHLLLQSHVDIKITRHHAGKVRGSLTGARTPRWEHISPSSWYMHRNALSKVEANGMRGRRSVSLSRRSCRGSCDWRARKGGRASERASERCQHRNTTRSKKRGEVLTFPFGTKGTRRTVFFFFLFLFRDVSECDICVTSALGFLGMRIRSGQEAGHLELLMKNLVGT
ncbi:uncharacterized protein LOC112344840 isoform X1 [Selaginella moellendorffii]|uniref:uncharacterized protein LOC112344840 isoform X1 n=1 Tax=Selaginella moellendorffii TaxID=88036 RepID=UPI000D1C705F|nr:uncharacterized protein LOC112344840 isoform X1 [Selaginella moellendorffii]|eukprot:XP_024526073.1 uncharacterized protein LOC112344840 isoform X1 [Selaginella moellendorffii]